MKTRAQLDAALDQLADMLPPWLARLRHEAQFWPQFTALAQDILDEADARDRPHVVHRIQSMLVANDKDSAGWAPGPSGRRDS